MRKESKDALLAIVVSFITWFILAKLVGFPITYLIEGSLWPSENLLVWKLLGLETALCILLVPFLMYKYVYKWPIRELGLSIPRDILRSTALGVGFGILATVLSFSIAFLIPMVIQPFSPDLAASLLKFERVGWMLAFKYTGALDKAIMYLLSIVLFLPAEEVHFRGFLQGVLTKRFTPQVAILVAGICFGIEQSGLWPYFMWYLAIGGVVVGLLHGYLYHKKGSLYPCVVSHLTFFFIAISVG